jgi:hypothetical protein
MADSIINDGQPANQPTEGDIDSRIAEIDAILASGASSVTVDGTTSSYDLEHLRKERLELLRRKESGTTTGQRRRPYFTRPLLG